MKEVFSYFRGQSDPFVIPEDYFALRDYAAASLTVLRQIFLAADIRKYDGLSIQPLLYKERISQASRAGKVRFLLYTSFIRRLKKAGWSIDYYVDMFENMFCEKPVLLEMHRSFPAAVTLGFQHATISPLMLKYFVNPDEIRRAPNMFPKKIVANGRFFADVLGLCGFAKESICIGPALRYQYLFESGREPKDEEKSVVLVVLPIMTDIAVEIFKRFLDVVEAIPCKIAVKAHPMMNRNTFLRNVGERELPLGCFWAEGSMSEWLPKAFCVVGGATAAVFEAVYAGTPVVLVGRELGLEMNPLGWWEEDVPMFRCCYEKGEMRESILRWITMAPEKGKEEVNKARAVLEGCFQPWEDARVESLFSHSGRYGYA
jgi:surface carbohydrate biosynthesis protein (TIGR04326 family)